MAAAAVRWPRASRRSTQDRRTVSSSSTTRMSGSCGLLHERARCYHEGRRVTVKPHARPRLRSWPCSCPGRRDAFTRRAPRTRAPSPYPRSVSVRVEYRQPNGCLNVTSPCDGPVRLLRELDAARASEFILTQISGHLRLDGNRRRRARQLPARGPALPGPGLRPLPAATTRPRGRPPIACRWAAQILTQFYELRHAAARRALIYIDAHRRRPQPVLTLAAQRRIWRELGACAAWSLSPAGDAGPSPTSRRPSADSRRPPRTPAWRGAPRPWAM